MKHMRIDISGAVRNRSFGGFTDNAGDPMPKRAVELELRRRLAAGEKFYPLGECPTFDPQVGCRCDEELAAEVRKGGAACP